MRKADAIKKYGGVHYTIEKGIDHDACVIVERLGDVPAKLHSVLLAHESYEDAQIILKHEYLKNALSLSHDDLLDQMTLGGLFEVWDDDNRPDEVDLFESVEDLRDYVIYSAIDDFEQIRAWNKGAELFLEAYSDHLYKQNKKCYVEESFNRRSSVPNKMLPDDINITENPLDRDKGAYAVFVEACGNVSIGRLSLAFNGVISYSTVNLNSRGVSIADDSVNLPVYKAYIGNREIGLVQYVEPKQHPDLSKITGSLNLYDGYIEGKGDGYDRVEVYLDKMGVVDCLSRLEINNPEKYNTSPAYSQLENL